MLRAIEGKRDRCRPTGAVLALVCTVLLAAGCSGGGDGGFRQGGPPAPGSPNPVDLAFRPTALGAPAAPDGRNWRTPEYRGHWGLTSAAWCAICCPIS